MSTAVRRVRVFPECQHLLRLCRLSISLQASLLQIVGYRNLVVEVEKLRREPYDCENAEHEEMLMKVRNVTLCQAESAVSLGVPQGSELVSQMFLIYLKGSKSRGQKMEKRRFSKTNVLNRYSTDLI